VNVIVAAADFVRRASDVATDSREIFEKLLFDIDVNPWVAVFLC
jgi:hypothetical protein